MAGSGTIDDPCIETVECSENEEIDACANLNCFSTCDTVLNYLNDSCPAKGRVITK